MSTYLNDGDVSTARANCKMQDVLVNVAVAVLALSECDTDTTSSSAECTAPLDET